MGAAKRTRNVAAASPIGAHRSTSLRSRESEDKALLRPLLENHHRSSPGHDPNVFEGRASLDVLEIEVEFAFYIVEGPVVTRLIESGRSSSLTTRRVVSWIR